MSFQIYTYPAFGFEEIEVVLRNGGFRDAIIPQQSPKMGFVIRAGFARARVANYTEAGDAEAHFNVVSGRSGIFSALLFWPIDIWLCRRIERQLKAHGARPIDLRNENIA